MRRTYVQTPYSTTSSIIASTWSEETDMSVSSAIKSQRSNMTTTMFAFYSKAQYTIERPSRLKNGHVQ